MCIYYSNTANNTTKPAKDEKIETKKMVSDKNKITALLSKKKEKKQKEEVNPTSNTLEKSLQQKPVLQIIISKKA